MTDLMSTLLEGIKDKGLAQARGYHINALQKQRDELLSALRRLTTACATNAEVMSTIDLGAYDHAVDVESQFDDAVTESAEGK